MMLWLQGYRIKEHHNSSRLYVIYVSTNTSLFISIYIIVSKVYTLPPHRELDIKCEHLVLLKKFNVL